ncbi:MAG: polyphosphate:AMP phosphotransferase [Gammaproteobacteria bacterium]|nr:polyphosphate:AMP phosphotransferase [Gammaproteobacteria bacterium]
MFEVAEVGRSLSKEEYKQAEPEVHYRLLTLQQKLRASSKALIVIVAGVEGAGKGEVVNKLNRWFDTRDVQTHAFWDETDEERERPEFWRYWRTFPARGSISVMFGSWYGKPITDRAFDKIDDGDFESELQRIEDLERTLTRDGNIIVKLWFHLPREEQRKQAELDSKNFGFKKPGLMGEYSKSYEQLTRVSGRAIRLTDTGFAPWNIIEATDSRYRDISVGKALISSLERALKNNTSVSESTQEPEDSVLDKILESSKSNITILDNLDLDQSLTDEEYDAQLSEAQQRLYKLAWSMHNQKKNAVLVFEGWDAAGKGSSIRRLAAAMDARLYRVIPVGAPTDEELLHHYLWRFWRQIPRAGFMTIYDRSWYGRVLVERIEKLADQREWLRSYQEINNFEENLTSHSIAVIKFWIHISNNEQLNRFKARENDVLKKHKITKADWRNREKWDQYKLAVNDMVAHTSTAYAPWNLIAGNDKKFARVQILNTVCESLEKILNPQDPPSEVS